jgi:hypothetical protein
VSASSADATPMLVEESPHELIAASGDRTSLLWSRGAEAVCLRGARETVGRPLDEVIVSAGWRR